MTPEEFQVCCDVHAGLASNDRQNINYLFLEPVDPNYFPTYLSIVRKPMDLRTLNENLKSGIYATKEEFYSDCQLIFDNAVIFNKDRSDSSFVVGLARKMTKAFEREKKKAERRAVAAASIEEDNTEIHPDPIKVERKKTLKLKLKHSSSTGDTFGKQSSPKTESKDDTPMTTKPKLTLSIKKEEDAPTFGGKKIKLKISRGKQLPLGVTMDSNPPTPNSANATKVTSTILDTQTTPSPSSANALDSENSNSLKASISTKSAAEISSTAIDSYADSAPMNSTRRAQCYKILSSLKRRQPSNCKWFLKPMNDPKLVKDYKEKIQDPMDLGTISSKLDKNLYPSVAHFVLDLRRVFSNCLQYNTTIEDSFRPVAVECLVLAEDLLTYFIAKKESPKIVYPSLLYCWEECLKIIDSLLNVTNPDDGHQTAWFFLHPVNFFFGGVYPDGYMEKVKTPIDLGTIVRKLITACYDSVEGFISDCRLVVSNCKAFYVGSSEEGECMLDKANRLKGNMEHHLVKLSVFDRSTKGTAAKEKAKLKCMHIKKPDKDFLRDIMVELRGATYTDKLAKITEVATTHFEKPVDTATFPDYLNFVECPMDLETVDKKIELNSYATPEDFEYDVALIFKNCERYNAPKNNLHMVALGKHTAKTFRKLFSSKMKSLEHGVSNIKYPILPTAANRVLAASTGGKALSGKKRPSSPALEEKQAKRVSIKAASRVPSKAVSASLVGKAAPNKTAKLVLGKKISDSQTRLSIDLNAPVPIHVAISAIKESYPGRRQNKDLNGWEEDCLKCLRHLLKHPWISAERPKYIFHVPVHIIFPEIREGYSEKIKNPMDLTTAEAKLLQGVYKNPNEFVSDIALIFSNARTFNREGFEIGEPMSCAYFEASTHLLKYSRWLSLEILQSYLTDSPTPPVFEGGCASEWELSIRNRDMAKKEMEEIVFNEHLDKTEKGDRFSWSEQECEKLMKSLRHMSDIKHMTFFIQMTFPPDYTAFISKPIAWELCQEKLRDRKYNTIGEIVSDLRLIFSNALKYNDHGRAMSKVSQIAYDSAIHMSRKLEQAIDRMLLSVSDRVGREKIDMINLHREMEAQERAKQEQLKAQWEKENPSATVEVRTKLRIVHQRSHRKRTTDFEFPFYDEEDEDQESHVDSLRSVKALFEKQQKERLALTAISLSVGMGVFDRLRQRAEAKSLANKLAYKRLTEQKQNAEKESQQEHTPISTMAFVSAALSADDRQRIKVVISQRKSQRARKKHGLSSL